MVGELATVAFVAARQSDTSHLDKQGITVRNTPFCPFRELLAPHALAPETDSGILCIYNMPPAIGLNDGFKSTETCLHAFSNGAKSSLVLSDCLKIIYKHLW